MKQFYKWLVIFTLMFTLGGQGVFAAEMEAEDPQSGISMSNAEVNFADDLFETPGISMFSSETSPFTGLTYTHGSQHDGKHIVYGIDVSKHNGTIDWNAVRANGIEYAMIRVGYRGYGAEGNLAIDENFVRNIEGALNAGLYVGVYIFSQAITEAEAIAEAQFVLDRIGQYDITLPVVMDFEYADTSTGIGGRLYNARLSKEAATNVCKAFAQYVRAAGYTPMIYANSSMLQSQLNAAELSQYARIWLAHYTTCTDYTGAYDVWQYTSQGRMSGIGSTYVDCNFWYGVTPEISDTRYMGKDYASVYDYEYYGTANPDVKNAFGSNKRAMLEHFVNSGMAEGRQAHPDFNVYTYKNRYADLRSVFGNDLKSYYMHYVNGGKAEGRSGAGTCEMVATTVYNGVNYASVYDYNFYTSTYGDIYAAFGGDDTATLAHFVNNGMAEGRQGSAEFDVYAYQGRYADLQGAFGSNLKAYYMHYLENGKSEGRNGATGNDLPGGSETPGGSGDSDGTGTESAPTVYEGVDYADVYDYEFYMNTYADLRAAFGDNKEQALAHFVNGGMAEGRQGSAEFNVYVYMSNYTDLQAAYGDNLKAYYMHYLLSGKSEGRVGA